MTHQEIFLELTFLRVSDNPPSEYLGLAFGARFLHDFSIKMFFNNTLSTEKVQCYILFPSRNIQQKVLSVSYLDNY